MRETLTGEIVVLEPLEERHRDELAAAAASSPQSFSFFTYRLAEPEPFRFWFETAIAGALAGPDLPFATRDRASGRLVGSSWLMTHVPEHRRIEIGNTWLVAGAWGSGANTEAKYLMLAHAFERVGVRRVFVSAELAL